MSVRVLVMGATGAVGAELVRQCVKDERIESVVALSRRPLKDSHSKLKVIVREDFLNYSDLAEELSEIDVCCCALGVSQVQVPDPKQYTLITLDYVVAAAKALKSANSDVRFCFVSGMGADESEKSSVLWRKVKGQAENRLREIFGNQLCIFRPAYIHPIHPREKQMWHEYFWKPFFGLKRFMPQFVTDTVEVSKAMINVSFADEMPKMVHNAELRTLAGKL
ncbi:MAG: NAD(P)H-binding protein [bacterium]|nr:NAD(P)H-binding protein [bacterium]